MGRLIDEDDLIKDRVGNDPVVIAAKAAPTACDLDRVVEQLKNLQDKAVNVRNADVSIYATGMMGKALNIVKAGGIE